ncbi:hypothetical protein ACTMTJ_34890 [Phytohabitans sp. LJ34]|uniref:hypothetical protein n=1 Tax=Phytohabitans sp. LJ34 TaxID=3452217 RepID=UPI003F8B3216
MAPIYPADHTAHIRQRLRSIAVRFLVGGVLAAVGAGVLALLGDVSGDRHRSVLWVAWGFDLLTFAVAALGLLATFVRYRIYCRRRADLNAEGAEAYGELRVRIHYG